MTAWIRCIAALALFAAAHASYAQTTLGNVNPIGVDFGAVKMGATVSVPVTIQNISDESVGIANGGISGTNLFTTDAATCGQTAYLLAAGASCYFTFTFTPSDASGTVWSTRVGILLQKVHSNASQVVVLTFSGSGNETLAQVSPVSIDFGAIPQGNTLSVPVTFLNTHAYPITFTGGGISGNDSPFQADSGTCPASLASGATCHFNYSFFAGDPGVAQTGTAVDVSASRPVPMTDYVPIALKGTSVAPPFPTPYTLSWPAAFDFGPTKVGHANTVRVYFQNNSSSPVTPTGGGFNNDQGGVFEAFSDGGQNCNTPSIPSGVTCTNQYVFQPHAAIAYSAASGSGLSNATGSNYYPLNVTGTGVGTFARVTPPTIDLGTVAYGTSASVPVVVTNTSDAPLTNFSGGQASYPFSANSTCGTSLAVGASCAYTYTFYAPSPESSLKTTYVASTILTFTNTTGIQPAIPIKITARAGDRIFANEFDGI